MVPARIPVDFGLGQNPFGSKPASSAASTAAPSSRPSSESGNTSPRGATSPRGKSLADRKRNSVNEQKYKEQGTQGLGHRGAQRTQARPWQARGNSVTIG